MVLIIFCLIATLSLVVLAIENGLSKVTTQYFANLNFLKVIYIIAFAAIMYIVNLVSAALLPATVQPLSIPGQTSIATSLIADVLFTFTVVALSEEALKISGYATLRSYYTKRLGPFFGVLISLSPIVLWAGFHAIQAYNNLWYLLPAFVDGLLLLALLELTKSFIAPVLAHGLYNSMIVVTSYLRNTSSQPLFPSALTASDGILFFLVFLWVVLGLILPLWIGGRESTKQKRLM
jgi:hypothetical protein